MKIFPIIVLVFLAGNLLSQNYLAPVQESETNLWGFIDEKGNLKISYKYIYVEEFSEGLALVFRNDDDVKKIHTEYINSKGETVISITETKEACKFDMWGTFEYEKGLFSFHEGLAAFLSSENKWGFIDNTGKIAIPCQFDLVGIFSEEIAYAIMYGQITGYIGKDGSWKITLADSRFINLYKICDCIYYGNPFFNGVASMSVIDRTQECEYYETILINKSGEIIFDKANEIGNFTETD